MISPLAYVDPSAQIGENVEIGPFCFIDKNVVIGDNNIIMPHVNIMYGSRIGNGNQIHPGAVIGGIPQDLKFRGEDTTAEIGDNCKVYPFFIAMAAVKNDRELINNHIRRHPKIGNDCMLCSKATVIGPVTIGDDVIIGACAIVTKDVPSHSVVKGLNQIRPKRPEEIPDKYKLKVEN